MITAKTRKYERGLEWLEDLEDEFGVEYDGDLDIGCGCPECQDDLIGHVRRALEAKALPVGIRYDDEFYTAPFTADADGDIKDGGGRLVHGLASNPDADVIARALNLLAEAEKDATDLVRVKCAECLRNYVDFKVKRHSSDEWRLGCARAAVIADGWDFKTARDAEDLDEFYCSPECVREAKDETYA